ncbi:MAG TPA: DUF3558 domain-containing protein [Pseudonocardiaceae bacterium]|jgi:hypothetical protein|nr:DUF3558 domain-containing protein [Pseudonocardiaceae bacterium]
MRRAPVVLALATLLAGCSAGGTQPTGAGAAPAASTSAPADPIPAVRDPKNLAGTPPCRLLTPAQLAANRIDQPGQPKDVLGAPGCEWDDKAHTREIRIYVDIGYDVLRNVYAQRATFPVFEVTQAAGHPAIRTKDLIDGTSCSFRVAAAERQTFVVELTSLRQGLEEPCGPAKALAEAVMGNLPPLKG